MGFSMSLKTLFWLFWGRNEQFLQFLDDFKNQK